MKYTAITIGPIYKTMQKARSSKAIWSASYLFSYMMRKLLICIESNTDLSIILPYSNTIDKVVQFNKNKVPMIDSEIFPVGLFPDRVLIKGEWKEETFNTCRKNIIKDISNTFAKDLKNFEKYKHIKEKDLQQRIENFLSTHLQIRRICVDLDDNTNIVFALNELCDAAELYNKTNPNAEETFLVDYFEKYKTSVNPAEYNDNVEVNFKKGDKDNKDGRPFKSTAEIATAEFSEEQFYKDSSKNHILGNKDKTKEEIGYDEQNAFYDDIKTGAENRFKNYHKYIAIVEADGDSVGDLITKIYENDSNVIEDFSKSLLAFSVKATQKIMNYNGSPVYAGGDDLLFFVPVAHTNGNGKIEKTILDLINDIDIVFEQEILENKQLKSVIEKLDKKPSMSYGINISYYKYPLDQALTNAKSLLLEKAKQGNKNAIALRVTKHSGQAFETILHKSSSLFVEVQKLFENIDLKSDFISGFMYKLSSLSEVIKGIALSDNLENRFDAFFENYFDEDIHKKSLEQGFLNDVKNLLIKIYQENEIKELPNEIEKGEEHSPLDKANAKNLNLLYSVLRFHQFINTKTEL